MFNLIHHDFPKITRIDSPKGRVYACPSSKGIVSYPSVTSVLSCDPEKEKILESWKSKVGEKEAAKISKKAAARGTRLHSLVENYLLGKPCKADLMDIEIWNPMRKVLEAKVNNIHAIEQSMFSEMLEVAGTVDLIAEYEGILSIIDIKTSARIKYNCDIPHYFEQCAVYSFMFEELMGIKAKRLQIIMGCDESNQTLLFDNSDRKIHLKNFMKKRKAYEKIAA